LTIRLGFEKVSLPMLRAALICVFLSLYILLLGPPLLIYTLVTRHVDPLYWAGVNGVMFFVRCVGVRVHVKGTECIPKGTVIFAANHTSSADAPAVVWSIPRRIAILLKRSLLEWPIVGQAFQLAHFIPVDRHNRDSAIVSLEKATEALRNGQSFLIYPEGTRGRRADCSRGVFWRSPHHGETQTENHAGRYSGGVSRAYRLHSIHVRAA
jgi:1-acyl-sn-glycerol-3-phosphate acyltransferase